MTPIEQTTTIKQKLVHIQKRLDELKKLNNQAISNNEEIMVKVDEHVELLKKITQNLDVEEKQREQQEKAINQDLTEIDDEITNLTDEITELEKSNTALIKQQESIKEKYDKLGLIKAGGFAFLGSTLGVIGTLATSAFRNSTSSNFNNNC